MTLSIRNNYLFILLVFCFLGKTGMSQEVSFTTTPAAKVVGVTDNFEVTYSSNKQGQFIQPKYKNFKVVRGVSVETFSNISYANGKTTKSTTFNYKLVLQAKRTGTFNIEGAKIKIGKGTYKSKPVQVKVVKESQVRQRPKSIFDQFMNGGGRQQQAPQITKEDMFVRFDVSKSEIYHNQPVVAEYNLYKVKYRCEIEGFEIPTYQNFLSDEIQLDKNRVTKTEVVNGIEYEVITLKKVLLTPQKQGKLSVKPFKVQIRAHTGSFFGTSVIMESNSIELIVKELPKPIPANFSNQVGKFKMNINSFPKSIEKDNPIRFIVTISGEGNLKQLGAPEVNFPKSLESYDPETTSEVNFSDSVMEGKVQFSYLLIPRETGDITIPSFPFTYFDLETESYKTITSLPVSFKVVNENGGTDAIEETDIDTDSTEDSTEENKSYFWFIVIPFMLLLIGGLYFLFVKKKDPKIETEEDRKRNARLKLAKKMAVAKSHLDKNEIEKFYDETLIGLNKYVNEKLEIKTSEMTKESIVTSLTNKQVGEKTTQLFIQVLESCEMAKYAPLSSQNNLEIYEKSIDVIEEIEGVIA